MKIRELQQLRVNATQNKPIHYVMWEIGVGGLELSVKHYIDHFVGRRRLFAYSLRPVGKMIYDDSKISVMEGSRGNWHCYRRYLRYCCRHRNEIFHLMNVGPLVVLLTLLAGVRNPVYHIHGTKHWHTAAQRFYLKSAWWLASVFRFTVVANSIHSASVFRKKILPRHSTIIYNGFETRRFSAKKHKREELRRMGYAGRLNKGKNVTQVIRLFEEIADRHPRLELFIAGDGPLRAALEKRAAGSPFASRIVFLGMVKDMPSFFESIDLLVFLSAHESFGNVIVEALLTGLPVLTSTVPAFDEIHGGEPDFVLGDPENFEPVRNKFVKAIEKYPTLAEIAWDMSDAIEEKFSIGAHLKKMNEIYENLH